jgi:hypothetical protein
MRTIKAYSHIACRAHAVPPRVYNVSFPFDLHSAAVSDSHLPCRHHDMLWPCRSSQGHSTARPSLDGRAVMWPWEERHGRSMAWECYGKCESDTAALCKSNGKDTFLTLSGTAWQWNGMAVERHGSGTAWQWNGMGAAWARHAMCESALSRPRLFVILWEDNSFAFIATFRLFLRIIP